MHMTCVDVMENEYIHVCTKRLEDLNFQLRIPRVKIMQNSKATGLHFHHMII